MTYSFSFASWSLWLDNPGPTVCVRTASDDQCILLISRRDSLGTNGCVRCLFIKTFASDGFDAHPPALATLVRRLTDESLRCFHVIMYTTINHRKIITSIDYACKPFKVHLFVVSMTSQEIKQSVRPPQCDKEQVWGEATFHLIQGYFGPMCGGRPFNLEIWSPSTIIFLKVSRWHCCPPLDIIGGGPSSLVLYAGGGKKFLWDCKKP